MTSAAGATLALGSGTLTVLLPARRAEGKSVGKTLAKFVDPLPILSVISPSAYVNRTPLYKVTMQQFKQKLHHDLPPTTLWGYNGSYPGPTFETRQGAPIAVHWMNNLPTKHFLPIDTTLHGDEQTPSVRTVVHVHGAKVLPESDGYPEAWFTKDFRQTGPYFTTQLYHYPNDQPATQVWYHDHALGTTRLNVYAGLAGLYFIRDDIEASLNFPRGPYEIPLLIQDRLLNRDGALLYPIVDTGGDPDKNVPPIWIPEFFGDTVLVNGKVWPYLEVEPRTYRFRIVNGSNARFYHLVLNESNADGHVLGTPGPAFYQIGTDGGFLPAPVRLTDLTIAPAERFNVLIDFSGAEGKSFVLSNDAKAPFPDGDDVIPGDVMLFRVTRHRHGRDTPALPTSLVPPQNLSPHTAVKTRDLVLSEADSADPYGNPIVGLINAPWDDPVTETPKAGSVEIWRIINTTEDAHPIHVHLVQFQILDRQPFDETQYPNRLVFTGPRVPPPHNEQGAFKDTVKTFPGEVTRIIARFDLPTGTQIHDGEKFRYVLHCHILEHEDNEMMRPYDVIG
jgi:spore coat protein A